MYCGWRVGGEGYRNEKKKQNNNDIFVLENTNKTAEFWHISQEKKSSKKTVRFLPSLSLSLSLSHSYPTTSLVQLQDNTECYVQYLVHSEEIVYR